MGDEDIDPGGNGHQDTLYFAHPPERVVSLIPSMTESMFNLGLGDCLVGITDFCIHPKEALAKLLRVGGTKDPRLGDILALQPDLVLANWEENTRPVVEALRAAGLAVWVTFPHTVRDSLDVLWKLAELFKSREAQIRLQMLELTLDWALSAAGNQRTFRYFCPIWYDKTQDGVDWWMTFNRHTYCHDLLELFGGQNIFGDRERKYPLDADLSLAPPDDPGEADTRYPRVRVEEMRAAQPELILLPTEPYGFDETHVELLKHLLGDTPAVRNDCIILVEGTLITWQGTRLAIALRELPEMLDSCWGK